MANNRSHMLDKNQLCEFVIQCCIHEGTVREVDKSKSKLESRWHIEFKREIPDELLIEILIRLPSKCICRYRTVNKHWCNLISSNHFINRHVNYLRELNGSHFIPNSFTLVFQDEFICRFPSVAINSSCEALPLHPDLVLCKSYNCKHFIPSLMQSKSEPKGKYSNLNHGDTVPTAVVSSCRDLLLCTCFQFSTYYVVNLITKQLMVLPSAPLLDHGQQPVKNRKPRLGILCYDSDGIAGGWCRFKVILVSIPPELGSSLFTLRTFCSESGEWTKLNVDWYPRTTQTDCYSGNMVPHNGMLHWVNGSSLVSLDLFNGDPGAKLSHMINLPEQVVASSPPYKLGISQGHFCVATFNVTARSCYILVWQVEDYHKGLWKLLHQTTLPFYTTHLGIVSFHPYRRDAIFIHVGHCVYLLDMKNVKIDKYVEMKLDKDYIRVHMTWAVLLRHQWFPTPVPSSCPLLDPATLSSSSNLSSHPSNQE